MVLTISIETGIQGGSIALFNHRSLLGGSVATENVSSAERVLVDLENLLAKYGLRKNAIKKIVLSSGPGSLTGLRIGEAITKGLKKTLKCDLVYVHVLKSMMSIFCESDKLKERQQSVQIAAVPFGRNQVIALYSNNFKNPKREMIVGESVSTYEDFIERIYKFDSHPKIILHNKLYREFKAELRGKDRINKDVINAGANLALLNGLKAFI